MFGSKAEDVQALLAAIVDSSDDAILSKSLDGTVLSWNAAAERLYGYTAAEIIGKPIDTLVPEDRPTEVEAILSKIGRGERIEHFETERVAKDGSHVVVSLTISPVRDSSGAIVGASTIARDITDAKRLRAEFEEQAELLDIAQDAILARALDGTITYWNQTAAEIYGWAKEEALGKRSHELLHTTFPKHFGEIEAELLANERWEGEISHVTRDGTPVIVESRWALRRDAAGNPFQVLEVNNDVTARRRAEKELAAREELLSAIFETSPDIIATITSDLELTYVNQAALDTLGYELHELFGENSLHWVHPDDLGIAGELLQTAFGAGETGARRLRVKNAAGEWVWLDIRIRPMATGSDNAVVMARDITDQVHLEEGLAAAKNAADEANIAKSEFLSRMSHELRTPLNGVLGFAQLLHLEVTSPAQKEAANEIVKAGKHLLDLINEVLDIAAIEARRLRLSLEPVDAVAATEECISLLERLATEENISLYLERPDIDTAERHVVADRQRLKQILLNLISNGIKYNREKGRVTVSFDVEDDSALRICVTDTGHGIPQERLPQLFVPFERLGAEASGIEGTGLGLALSRSLVEAMGGVLTVATKIGEGTTFSVQLKRSEDTLRAIDDRPSTPDMTTRIDTAAASRTLLYIEDNLANMKLVERLIERRPNIELIPAMQGGLGVDLAREQQPDLILLDVNLPDLPGREVLLRLQADPRTAGIPVVMLSADATTGQIQRLLGAGARDYLTKPLDITRFYEVVDQYCAG